jgi:alpha-tubulin suppressor-like RCC1 family protein
VVGNDERECSKNYIFRLDQQGSLYLIIWEIFNDYRKLDNHAVEIRNKEKSLGDLKIRYRDIHEVSRPK